MSNSSKTCPECKGTGRQCPCGYCSKGKMTCPTCNGTGTQPSTSRVQVGVQVEPEANVNPMETMSTPMSTKETKPAITEDMIKHATEYSSLSQKIQMMVWEYMDLEPHKRNGVELAGARFNGSTRLRYLGQVL